MSDDSKAIILHDTFRIIAANPRACTIFHCDESDLIDVSMLDLIADVDFRGLAAARLKFIREIHDLHDQDLPLHRPNGTQFYANVQTRRINETLYESVLIYKYDIPRR